MNQVNLSVIAKYFNDDDSARALLESILWLKGPICPHCNSKEAYRLIGKSDSKRPARKGLYKCKKCRKQFTVTVGTIFEDSHIPLSKWLLAIHLLCSSKKGMSTHQLHRMLGITYKSAWFMAHRIRYAMTQSPLADKLGGFVEVDETYIGGKARGRHGRGAAKKTVVFALLQRNGQVRSTPVENVTAKNLKGIIRENIAKDAYIFTDDFSSYRGLGKEFRKHVIIPHTHGDYGSGQLHTNTVEGYFSLLKRGLNGVYHHVSKQHLQRYLDEFNFRYSLRKITDGQRGEKAIIGAAGKRLTYNE